MIVEEMASPGSGTTEQSEASARQHARRLAMWCAAGFLLLQLGWVAVMPPATGIDEFDHLYRASAIAQGHWRPAEHSMPITLGRGGLLPVRADLAEASGPACAVLAYTGPFNCRPYRQISSDVVEMASAAYDYNPTYYAVVGTLGLPFRGNAAIYAMRTVTLVACVAGFALAVYVTDLWARTSWPVVALLLSALPTTVYSTSIVSPNGVHMTSGLVAWAGLVALLVGKPAARGPAYLCLTLGLALMVNTHTLGVLWLGLFALTVLIGIGPRRAITLLAPRGRIQVTAAVVLLAAVVLELWWLAFAHPNDPGQPEGAIKGSPWSGILSSLVLWPLQAIGAFPRRNDAAPVALYACAVVVLGWFAWVTVRALRGQSDLVRMVVTLLVGSVVVPIALTYLTYSTLGFSWQGRYGMPYSVGLFVLAGAALDRSRPSPRAALIATGVPFWVLAQVIGQLGVRDMQLSYHSVVRATHWWALPPAGVAALGILAAAAWLRATRLAAHQRRDVDDHLDRSPA